MTSLVAPRQLALIPRDGLFCKDGRGWHTSSSGRGHALDWPWPSTILGALRTAWGRTEEARSQQRFDAVAWGEKTAPIVLGRTLVLRRRPGAAWSASDRVWPVPSDALWLDCRDWVCPLRPEQPKLPTLGRLGAAGLDEAREALWVPCVDDPGKPKPPPRWWSEANFIAWLSGDLVAAGTKEKPDAGSFAVPRRMQAHVGILEKTLTADEGVLFAHDVVETLERRAEWAIGAEAMLPEEALPPVATLGADGRLARIEMLEEQLFAPPEPLMAAFGREKSARLRLVVVAPTEFEHGWLPDGFEREGSQLQGRLPGVNTDLILRAAIVGRPVHVSGWDMAANEPKHTSRMVPPGSVYFFERKDGKTLSEDEARALWLAPLGRRTNEGFGRAVPGNWPGNLPGISIANGS